MTPTPPLLDGYVRWLRSYVGHQLIYLVYAAAVVFDERGRILVQSRYDFDWLSVPGGVLELGESLPEAARREVYEETGIRVELRGLAGLLSHPRYNLLYPNGDQVQQWTAVFWGEAAGGDLRPDGGETLSAFFIEPDEFLHKTHPSHEQMIRYALHARSGAAPLLEPVESFPPLQPYYPILRAHVGHERVILPGTLAVIEDERGRILMTQRADFNCWDFPSGFADLGETTTANIVREVEEETGLIVEPYAIIGLYSEPRWHDQEYPNGDKVQGVGPAFACRVTGGALIPEGKDGENTAVAFLPVGDILAWQCSEATARILADYQDRAGWPHLR